MGWNWNGYCCSGCAGSSDPVLALGFFPFKSGKESDRDYLLKVSRAWLVFTFEVYLAVGPLYSLAVSGLLGYLCLSIVNWRCIPRTLAQIFSNDPAVLDLFQACRLPFAAFVVRVSEASL